MTCICRFEPLLDSSRCKFIMHQSIQSTWHFFLKRCLAGVVRLSMDIHISTGFLGMLPKPEPCCGFTDLHETISHDVLHKMLRGPDSPPENDCMQGLLWPAQQTKLHTHVPFIFGAIIWRHTCVLNRYNCLDKPKHERYAIDFLILLQQDLIT